MRTLHAVQCNPAQLRERRGQWLLALMVIAATAVIVVSLIGIARMTGFFPRAGMDSQQTETIRDKARGVPKEREGGSPGVEPRAPATVPEGRSRRRLA